MSVKIIHTSDWHLGKKLFKKDRIEEQSQFLDWLHNTIDNQKIDILIIAGDIFDVPSPPNKAVELYFKFLKRVSEINNTHIFIISGNHDSASFLQAPSKILNRHNIHIYTSFPNEKDQNTFCFKKDSQTVEIKCIPYFRSFDLNANFSENLKDIGQHEYLKLIKKVSNQWGPNESYKILVSHHAYGEFSASKSEHTLNLAGLESIPIGTIAETADYIALGHIHKPQKMSSTKNIYYSGSPIPLRFSETMTKRVKLIDTEKGITDIKIPSFRDLIKLKGNKDQILDRLESLLPNKEEKLTTWIEIQVQLDEPAPKLLTNIKAILISKNMELLSYYPIYKESSEELSDEQEALDLNLDDVFIKYYKSKFPNSKDVPKELLSEFKSLTQIGQDED